MEIEQRQSVSESMGSQDDQSLKFLPVPDLTVYQGDVNLLFKPLNESSINKDA